MGNILVFPGAVKIKKRSRGHNPQRDIASELARYQFSYGQDEYSRFIETHNRLPNADEAGGLGRLLGRQVKAGNGRNYPILSKSQNQVRSLSKSCREQRISRLESIEMLSNAVKSLSLLEELPAKLEKEDFSKFDISIANHIETSISLLFRFLEAWYSNDKEFKGPSPNNCTQADGGASWKSSINTGNS